MIRAAGGVLWRGPRARREVALVHRPRYDDWTLPKGKLKRDESPLVAAVREVWEETGVRVSLGTRLPTVSYATPRGRGTAPKTVDYWSMTVVQDNVFRAGAETDDLAWLPIPAALRQLSYARDVTVLSAFSAQPALRPPIVLLAAASTAEHLVDRLRCFSPQRLVSAPSTRSQQALRPVAEALGLPVVTGDITAAAVRTLARRPAVVCAPRATLAAVIAELTGLAPRDAGPGWILSLPIHPSARAILDNLG